MIVRRESTRAPHDWPVSMHPVLQQVYAARGVACPDETGHRLAGLLPPDALGGLECATGLLANAIDGDARILIAGDFDCDGATGCAVGVRGLRMLGARNVGYVVPDRAVHGYGLTPALVATLQPAPDLIVTVDNGIASLAGVAAAKARGSKVIVTDHHLPGPALPGADAIVNPNAAGDGFASKNLCGVGVMFYLLLALRARLGKRDAVDLAPLLDLVALGTVADLVPLDHNNRALVEAGLRRIRAGRACAGIASLFEVAGRDVRNATASDLGFAIGPRINAAGRLEDMSIGVECLLADDAAHARGLAAVLNDINAQRRDLQTSMVEQALVGLVDLPAGDAVGVSLFDPGWHHGVVGLVAAKVKERLHRPVVAFAPAGEDDVLRGSARSVPGFHVRDALAEVDARCPGLIERFGGHAMAAGLSLRLAHYARFAQTFDAVVRERIAPESLQAVLASDGELAPRDFVLDLARQLRLAGPWGQGFPAPLFDNVFECVDCRPMGSTGAHRRLQLRDPRDGRVHDAVWFNTDGDVSAGVPQRFAYELMVNDWQGRESLRLLVRHVEPA
ncbi:MAG: single-stranded-DNA-specific exonuclease RecJ [Lysobacterales bacterium 66-474]|nr:MAG: single-stranded-DNA-specific exonuclease RecJ [Rhodanobacter sp. SCN 66-43]OJY84161.1 MAG: single-stranded-DNA-specific exonuclease RecJ [Xanthomonadales bacterium 66-474]